MCSQDGQETPLHLAVAKILFPREDAQLETIELLLQAGASPSPKRRDAEENTPLHDAVKWGCLQVVRLLLKYGADPNAVNSFGETPLHSALQKSRMQPDPAFGTFDGVEYSLIQTLLEAGADPIDPDTISSSSSCRSRGTTTTNTVENSPSAAAREIDPKVCELLMRWANWRRRRLLAWAHSRGTGGHTICKLPSELAMNVARFL